MQRARVIGKAVSTAKHPTMQGFRLLIVQPLTGESQPDADPLIVVDTLGAGSGAVVIVTSDGKYARQLIGSKNTPVRYVTIGVED